MRLVCLIGHHKPSAAAVRNQGFEFSTCRSCGGDMVRSGRAWRRVPRGFRVVWRQPSRRPAAASADRRRAAAGLAVPPKRPNRRSLGLASLVDLVRAAMRVMLWNLGDRWRGISLRGLAVWVLALPRRDATLRLPPP